MYGCSAVRAVDLPGFPSLESVGDGWMAMCPVLRNVCLGPCPTLERVGAHWMSSCPGLVNVELWGLSGLVEVAEGWLFDCPALTRFFVSDLPRIDAVGPGFLHQCDQLLEFEGPRPACVQNALPSTLRWGGGDAAKPPKAGADAQPDAGSKKGTASRRASQRRINVKS
jgi:hypothetical protein